MKLIFAGTPEFAKAALVAILDSGHHVELVLTQPDRMAGRGMYARASAVKMLAEERGLNVFQPSTLREAAQQERLRAVGADVMVVAAYGLILPQQVLEIPTYGCLNIHASLLPRWRGAAPIQRAILAGDAETGITIMQMDAGLDTGAILLQKPLPIAPEDTAQTLHDKLAALGATAILEALEKLASDALNPVAQDEASACYAPKITKAEAALDWRRDAGELARAVRAYNPTPGAHTWWQGTLLKLWAAQAEAGSGVPGTLVGVGPEGIRVACGRGVLRVTELQRAGGKRLGSRAFLQGIALKPGDRFVTMASGPEASR